MRSRTWLVPAVAVALLASTPSGAQPPRQGEEQGRQRTEQQVLQRNQIYGQALMTEQERNEYRQRLQSMTDEQARSRFEHEHRKAMQDRARQQGKALDGDGNVLSGDRLQDRDQDRDRDGDRDQDRDQIRRMDQTSRPATAPTPRQGGGRGGG